MNLSMRLTGALLWPVLLGITPLGHAYASNGGIRWPPETRYRPGEAKCPRPLSNETRTVLGVLVDERAVDAAERILGPSPLHQEGDAASSRRWRCWEAEDGDGTVLYVARGEVHGELRILGPDIAFDGRGACPKSKLVHKGLATASGLRLGLSRSQVEKEIGPPSKVGKGWYERACVTKRRMAEKEMARWKAEPGSPFVTVSSTVRVFEKAGKAVGIQIAWSEAY